MKLSGSFISVECNDEQEARDVVTVLESHGINAQTSLVKGGRALVLWRMDLAGEAPTNDTASRVKVISDAHRRIGGHEKSAIGAAWLEDNNAETIPAIVSVSPPGKDYLMCLQAIALMTGQMIYQISPFVVDGFESVKEVASAKKETVH